MSKLKAGDVTMWATTTLMDLVGPYSWSTECPLEKWFRDAKIYQLFEGTAEIQRMVISRMQAREYAERLGYRRRSRRAGDGRAGQGARSSLVAVRRATGASSQAASREFLREAPGGSCAGPKLGACTSHAHAHALEARRGRQPAADVDRAGDQRRDARSSEAVGGLLTGSLAVLADAGHLLSDVGSIGLALFAASLASRPGRRAAHLRLPALGGAGGAGQRAAAGRGRDRRSRSRRSAGSATRRRSTAAASSRSACSASPATSPRPSCSPRGEREDINLEGVLRHSAADALGSLGVVIAGAVVLAGGSSIVDPIVGLRDRRCSILASSWRLIKEPFDVLMEAAPAGVDVDAIGAAICSEEGVRSVHDLHVWTVTAGLRRPRRPRRRRRGLRPRPDPPPARAAAARALRHRPHDAADGGGGLGRSAAGRERPSPRPDRKPGCTGDFRCRSAHLDLASLGGDASEIALPWRRLSSPRRRSSRCSLASPPRPPKTSSRSSKPRKRSSPRCANARAC